MIAYLEGKLSYKSPALVHVDVNGVGYEVHISLNTYSAIQAFEKVKLFTYLQVKEDSHSLFGFSDRQEKEIFVLFFHLQWQPRHAHKSRKFSLHFLVKLKLLLMNR